MDDIDVARFHEQGFTTVEQLATTDELERFAVLYDEVLQQPYKTYEVEGRVMMEAWVTPQTHAEMFDTAFVRRSREIAGKLLDADPDELSYMGQILFKPPQRGSV